MIQAKVTGGVFLHQLRTVVDPMIQKGHRNHPGLVDFDGFRNHCWVVVEPYPSEKYEGQFG